MASFLISIRSKTLHDISREAQRLALLEDSYGKVLESFQVVEVRKRAGTKLDALARQTNYIQPYYTSTKPTGNARLRENIQQSAFWSRNLLELYGNRMLYTIISLVVAVVFITYILLVIASEARYFQLNPYLLSLGAIILVLGFVEYLYVYVSCNLSVKLLLEVDQRLDRVDIDNAAVLLANFADYSIASVTAPPIPFGIYKRNQDRLRSLWQQRLEGKAQQSVEVAPQSAEVPIHIDDQTVPTWIATETFIQLLRDAAAHLSRLSGVSSPTNMSVSRIASFSGTPVFDVKVYQGPILWRQLVLRLHRLVEEAKKELAVVQRISNEMVDVICYVPFKQSYIERGLFSTTMRIFKPMISYFI